MKSQRRPFFGKPKKRSNSIDDEWAAEIEKIDEVFNPKPFDDIQWQLEQEKGAEKDQRRDREKVFGACCYVSFLWVDTP